MPSKKISELNSATPTVSTVLPASDAAGTATSKITVQQILDLESRWDAFKPGTPGSVSATAGNGQATVSWSAPTVVFTQAGITDYAIQYSSNSGATWTSFSHAASAFTTATVTGLTNGTAYIFRVAATNFFGTSAYSSVTSAVTPVGPPAAPTGVTVTGGDTQANVSWTAPTNTGGSPITDYVVQFSSNGGVSWGTWAHAASAANSLTVTELTNNTGYIFQVAAVNAVGQGSFSAASSPVVPAARPPGAPTGLSATVGIGSIALSWTAPTDTGTSPVNGYAVRYTPAGGNQTTVTLSNTATTYNLSGLANGTVYSVVVAAQNAAGYGTDSASASATTPDVPSVPAALAVTVGNGQVALAWNAPTSNGSAITNYRVQYAPTGGATTTVVTSSTSPSYTITGLTNDTAYTFAVAAVNAVGTGSYTSPAPATPTASVLPPPAPSGLSVSPGQASLALSWTAPTVGENATVTGYRVQYTPSGGSATAVNTNSAATSFTLTGLPDGTSYSVAVAAINSAGAGPYSTAASGTTYSVPAPPTALSATSGDSQLALSWTAPSSNGGAAITGYLVQYTPYGGSASTATTGSTSNSYTLVGLTNGTAYTVSVAAINAVGTGSYSSSASGTPANVAPLELTKSAGVSWSGSGSKSSPYAYSGTLNNATFSNGNNRLTFTAKVAGVYWFSASAYDTPDDNGWASVFRILKNGTVIFQQRIPDGLQSVSTQILLAENDVLTFDFPVINGSYAGVYISNVSCYLAATSAPIAAPTSFRVNLINAAFLAEWVAVANTLANNGGSDITGYHIEYTPAGGTAGTVFVSAANTLATVPGLTTGIQYAVRVAAVNARGIGPYSAAVNATPVTTALNLTRTAGVAWTGAGTSASQYAYSGRIDTAAYSSGSNRLTFTATLRGVFYFASLYDDPADDNGTTVYLYRNGTRIFSAGTNGPLSITQNFVAEVGDVFTVASDANLGYSRPPLANTAVYLDAYPTISVPTNVTATGGNGQVSLSWTTPDTNANLITDYRIEYSFDGGTTWRAWQHTASPSTSATITGLWNGVEYLFRVTALGTTANYSSFGTPSAAVTPSGNANASALNSFVIVNYSSGSWSGTGPVATSSVFGPVNNAYLPFTIAGRTTTDVTIALRHQNATADDNHGRQGVYFYINGVALDYAQFQNQNTQDTTFTTRLNTGDILAVYVSGSAAYDSPTDTYTNISITAASPGASKLAVISNAWIGYTFPTNILANVTGGTGTLASPFTLPGPLPGGNSAGFLALASGTINVRGTLANIPDDNTQNLELKRIVRFNQTGGVAYISEGATATATLTVQRGQVVSFQNNGTATNFTVWEE